MRLGVDVIVRRDCNPQVAYEPTSAVLHRGDAARRLPWQSARFVGNVAVESESGLGKPDRRIKRGGGAAGVWRRDSRHR